jgi:hypothetical protein
VSSSPKLIERYIRLRSRDTGLERIAWCERLTKGDRLVVAFAGQSRNGPRWTRSVTLDDRRWLVDGPATRAEVQRTILKHGRHPDQHEQT